MAAAAILYVRDLDRMREFYVGCFDFLPVEFGESFVVLRSDQWELTLVVVPDEIARQSPLADPPVRRERVPVKLGLSVPSIDAVRPTFERLGGAADDPSRVWEFGGQRRCDATDPEGNVLQILEPSADQRRV